MRVQTWDAIVIGVGGMGAAACYHLARRGARVLGIEQFDIVNERGSSHGGTRICRKAYFEHPDYVPLADASYRLWEELGAAASETLFDRTGLILSGPENGEVIPGVRRAAEAHSLPIDVLPPRDAAERFPGFVFPEDHVVLYESDAGLLWVERCVAAHARLARRAGAALHEHECVRSWRAEEGGVVVETERGRYAAGALVVCAGAWAGRLLAPLGLPLSVRRKVQLWLRNRDPRYRRDSGCPVFGFEWRDGFFYGFPEVEPGVVKAAEHTGDDHAVRPEALDRFLRPADVVRVRRFLAQCLPGVGEEVARHSVCMYTMTPDSHFIVDRHPQHERVFVAAGFSGHGFKFSPLIGRILADWILDGRTSEPIGFLSLRRETL